MIKDYQNHKKGTVRLLLKNVLIFVHNNFLSLWCKIYSYIEKKLKIYQEKTNTWNRGSFFYVSSLDFLRIPSKMEICLESQWMYSFKKKGIFHVRQKINSHFHIKRLHFFPLFANLSVYSCYMIYNSWACGTHTNINTLLIKCTL